MSLKAVEKVTEVERKNKERRAAAETEAKQMLASAQRDGLALLEQMRAEEAAKGAELLRQAEERAAVPERPKASAPERPRERKLKFSYKEQREFETIDDELAALEAQVAECQVAQECCGSDYVKLQELQARQTELEQQLEEKTERWMYLNELKEKIDSQNA